MTVDRIRLSPHFSLHEFACPCCGVSAVDPKLLFALERLRSHTGLPIFIHHEAGGAFRCRDLMVKMIAEGKTKTNSQHALGRAVDWHMQDFNTPDTRHLLAELALMLGLGGVGIYPWGLHTDTRPIPEGGEAARWEEKGETPC